jgi:uncharacterized membrane protein (DUF4010 family)
MPNSLVSLIPADAFKLFLVIFLSFLIGLEREEQKVAVGHYAFGGVRTYPLLGLVGYALASISTGAMIPLALGFVVVGGFLMLAYWHKLQTSQGSGFTSETAGLMTYLIGALIHGDRFWVATAIAITSVILLELKATLEGLTQTFSPTDILTFTQFLFLSLVILPILPNQAFGPFQINPFKTWLVVVAVSAISYGSFLLQRTMKGRGGVMLSALLGGAYSSTVTTVALAKRSLADPRPRVYAGSMVMASGMMYLRLALLVSLFNAGLRQTLLLPFGILGIVGIAMGAFWARSGKVGTDITSQKHLYPTQNPLELKAAFLFAGLFVSMVMLTHYVVLYLGNRGIFTLAAIMGVTDVDPFILGMTQSAGQSTALLTASAAIAIAAASNNLVKGFYALFFSQSPGQLRLDWRTPGTQALGLLSLLAIVGLTPLLWLL